MFDHTIGKLEKDIETFVRLLSLLNNICFGCQVLLPWLWQIGTREKFSLCSWERRYFSSIISRRRGFLE
jgi:hypothetical protein